MSLSFQFDPILGVCACRQIRYEFSKRPIYVHCCHCRYCQRETGAPFALNAMYEADSVKLTNPDMKPEIICTPTASGNPQSIARCPSCKVAVWSHYGSHGGDLISFVRIGTLDEPDLFPPDMHIYTASQQLWVKLGDEVLAVDKFYDRTEYWPKEKLERFAKVSEKGEKTE
ncbi:glutathione-dependent formaldehyde-activating protein [Pseudomassariella vexata]|uniref:Glutathione-dependent formaldehyde-activating protein n=1 Tax=Pseudomassariella vexata TaxID=1141098 RepID=A0A1Y2DN20_9PEZI|nr:glutathione-dependent formaldehyde-activating protein [Pseudomassariella vexata]ORY60651.1 glutathione-dependent formaldehyde-activating protein [Pseudomassariella vexata]